MYIGTGWTLCTNDDKVSYVYVQQYLGNKDASTNVHETSTIYYIQDCLFLQVVIQVTN